MRLSRGLVAVEVSSWGGWSAGLGTGWTSRAFLANATILSEMSLARVSTAFVRSCIAASLLFSALFRNAKVLRQPSSLKDLIIGHDVVAGELLLYKSPVVSTNIIIEISG